MRHGVRLALAPLVLGLVVGCASGGPEGVAPSGPAPSVSTPAGPTAPVSPTADLKAGVLAKAMASGETPTDAGMSDVVLNKGSGTFLWETDKGRLCLAQVTGSGSPHARMCGDPLGATPEQPGSPVSRAFGPGTAPEGWMVVLLAEHSHRVTSVRFRGEEADWKFVRTLAPALSGRDVYYVPLRDAPTGDLELTFDVGGQQRKELLRFT
ncbi:hypothetical protein [Streptomyces sp. NBC_01294]|uniref:hypothetical protein n=1 Tax=Streptomyces sp. NBC_01294 TaxID=2903815 RepID=UPI002DDC592C|nr:hypothetical protein [Streptomyces sp. NBC_01294]WRZ57132.1 hypothetical protein OG534_11935 [Streptomyces sp. NBC_01294]